MGKFWPKHLTCDGCGSEHTSTDAFQYKNGKKYCTQCYLGW
jgi:formylmethanofuran dehydrogenase subunit E